jgi:hypothetical protein
VAQAGLWDVDGNGLSEIQDSTLARAILDKVNRMNVNTGVRVLLPVAVFAALPQSQAAPLVACTLLCAALYASRDKIPTQA